MSETLGIIIITIFGIVAIGILAKHVINTMESLAKKDK